MSSATPRPRIYADFNGLVAGIRDPSRTAVVLDTYGTARDLANAGIILHEGCELVAFDWSDDDEDLEGHGSAHYDRDRRWWILEFDEQGVRYVPKQDRPPIATFLCISCRQAISPTSPGSFADADTRCPFSGTSVWATIAEPDSTSSAT